MLWEKKSFHFSKNFNEKDFLRAPYLAEYIYIYIVNMLDWNYFGNQNKTYICRFTKNEHVSLYNDVARAVTDSVLNELLLLILFSLINFPTYRACILKDSEKDSCHSCCLAWQSLTVIPTRCWTGWWRGEVIVELLFFENLYLPNAWSWRI